MPTQKRPHLSLDADDGHVQEEVATVVGVAGSGMALLSWPRTVPVRALLPATRAADSSPTTRCPLVQVASI